MSGRRPSPRVDRACVQVLRALNAACAASKDDDDPRRESLVWFRRVWVQLRREENVELARTLGLREKAIEALRLHAEAMEPAPRAELVPLADAKPPTNSLH